MKHSTHVKPSVAKTKLDVVDMVSHIIRTRHTTHAEYQRLFKLILADGTIDEKERQQINRLFDAIQAGRVKVVG